MEDSLLLNGFGILFLVFLAASIWYLVTNRINRYKATNYAILKTHITVYELQKMKESRKVCKSQG
ncbi:MAG TPA: hypothetical protein DD641_06725 [Deltaproteobacteria bacterium]|nr:hypothetical protein [Deltaproteobacteria bacterium]